MHILHTVLYTFAKELTRRICLTIKSNFSWWSFPSFWWPSLTLKLDVSQPLGSKCYGSHIVVNKYCFSHIAGICCCNILLGIKRNIFPFTLNKNAYSSYWEQLHSTRQGHWGPPCRHAWRMRQNTTGCIVIQWDIFLVLNCSLYLSEVLTRKICLTIKTFSREIRCWSL